MDNSPTSPNAWDLGYMDGRIGKPLWRQLLKPEYVEEYDRGFKFATGLTDHNSQVKP
jgi:hypothetical protein